MAKGKKFLGKKKRGFKPHLQKSKKSTKEPDIVNKKAIFNRYKNKQKVEEELSKKKFLEQKFQQPHYSESEEEEDTLSQLVSCFSKPCKNKYVEDTDESSGEMDTDNDLEISNSDHESIKSSEDLYNADKSNNEESDKNEPKEQTLMVGAEDNDPGSEMETTNDPFTKHLQYDLSDELVVSLSSTNPITSNTTKIWPVLGNLVITIPKALETFSKAVRPKISILEEKTFAPEGTVPHVLNQINFNNLFIKSQIQGNIVSANKTNLIKRDLDLSDIFTPLQKEIFAIINNYQDLYFAERTFSNADEIRYTYCLHVINHMLKTRTKILHHNAKLSRKSEMSDEYRDQGLVRPKVLIMVPFKDAAYRIVKTIIDILVPKESGQVVNKKRFEDDFTGGELLMPTKNPKPEDYELLFSGNTEDTFRLGMTLTKKTLKLYTDFYSSDLLIASPLGLRMIIGAEGEEDRDYDFLASIEILIMDQMDIFLMQNWDHLLHVLDHLHLQPKKTHDTDFSRVRSWAVNGWSKYYRQTLMFSSVSLPEIKSVLNRKCQNYAGKVVSANPCEIGTIQQVVLQVPQLFHSRPNKNVWGRPQNGICRYLFSSSRRAIGWLRDPYMCVPDTLLVGFLKFNASSPLASVDSRFEYFIKEVLPKQRDTLMSHTLIYVPSYFDFVRIRNYFKKEDIGFVQICEYSKDGKIARARDMFFHTEAHFLLYSERVHFFRRFRIKGIRHIIFYQPPTYPHFYSEMCNLMQESNQNKYGGSECNMTVTTLHCKYDVQRVAAILGASRFSRIANSDKSVHMFVTGE